MKKFVVALAIAVAVSSVAVDVAQAGIFGRRAARAAAHLGDHARHAEGR